MKKYNLEELCSVITDGTHQTPEYSEEGYIFLSSKDVTTRKINWENTKKIPKQLHETLSVRLKPQINDILLAKNGTTGVAAIVDRDEIFDIYVSLALLRPREIVYPKYLLYAVNSPQAKRQFDGGLKGIGVPNLHLSVIRKTEIQLPRLERQQKIVKHLEAVDKLIEIEKERIAQYDVLIKSRFVEMFGDPVSNTLDWNIVEVGDVCFVTKLAGFEYTEYIKYQDHGDVVMVRGLNVKEKKLKLDDVYYIDEKVSDMLPRSQLKENDIVMTYVGVNIGDVALVDGYNRYHLAPNVAKISLNSYEMLNPIFFVNLLAFNKENYASNATNTAKQALNMDKIRKLQVMLPPIDLQNQFENFAKQVDKLKVANILKMNIYFLWFA